jgi:hypothetical protein
MRASNTGTDQAEGDRKKTAGIHKWKKLKLSSTGIPK